MYLVKENYCCFTTSPFRVEVMIIVPLFVVIVAVPDVEVPGHDTPGGLPVEVLEADLSLAALSALWGGLI